MARWRVWTADQFRQQPVVAWMALVVVITVGSGALLSALGVIGDWGRWATGGERPEIVEFHKNDLWDDPSYYVVVHDRGATQVRLFAVDYQSSPARPPGKGHPEPMSALLAEHEFRIPFACGAKKKVELDPNFVVEANKSEGFRLTLVAPADQRGRECDIRLRFDSSAGPSDWYEFTSYFQRPHKPCKIVHGTHMTKAEVESAFKDSNCVELRP